MRFTLGRKKLIRMPRKKSILTEFEIEARRHFRDIEKHNFHDATLQGIQMRPPLRAQGTGHLEVGLGYPHAKIRFLLTFLDCSHVEIDLDFDVLRSQLPHNTCVLKSETKGQGVAELMREKVQVWNVEFSDLGSIHPMCIDTYASPMDGKLMKAGELCLHEIKFFGGLLRVISRHLRIQEKRR